MIKPSDCDCFEQATLKTLNNGKVLVEESEITAIAGEESMTGLGFKRSNLVLTWMTTTISSNGYTPTPLPE
jgi:hypothetical protein